MNDEEIRDALADTIKRRWVLRGDARANDLADALLPVVRGLIADELWATEEEKP